MEDSKRLWCGVLSECIDVGHAIMRVVGRMSQTHRLAQVFLTHFVLTREYTLGVFPVGNLSLYCS